MERTVHEKRWKTAVKALSCCVLAMWVGLFSVKDLPGYAVFAEKQENVMLVPGGTPFGVRFYTKGAAIYRVEENSAAEKAGLVPGDIIEAVEKEEVQNGSALTELVKKYGGAPFTVEFIREGSTHSVTVKNCKNEGEGYYMGVCVRDSLAGIGTLTFYDPQTGAFAGLGHGICEGNRGEVLPLGSGNITDVRLTSVTPGKAGAPGQLRGLFSPGSIGVLERNTAEGVFGHFTEKPKLPFEGAPLPVASENEIKAGKAEIYCTLAGGQPEKYTVEIEKILSFDSAGKNFIIHITDEQLISRCGGIVQGMSGSPILQNGKIVGAVTHVMVDDPARGYGIYIGKMLDAMYPER